MPRNSGHAGVRLAAFALAALPACGEPAADPAASGSSLVSAEARALLATLRYDEGPPPADPSNRVADDPAAALFGQRLFFDVRFSGPLIEGDNDGSTATLGRHGEAGRVSCAGCHVPADAFVDTRSAHRQVSLASMWTLRRAPTLLDVSFRSLYNWDGRRDSTWNQAAGVIESEREFNSSRLFVAQQVFDLYRAAYTALFGELPPLDDTARFPRLAPEAAGCVERVTMQGARYDCRGKPGDQAEFDGLSEADRDAVTRVMVNATKAIGAYLRALRCGPSRFDAWLDGDAGALSESEQRGAELFVGRGGCVTCHSGPGLTDEAFHNVGLAPATVAVAIVDSNDRGAAEGIAEALADPLSTHGPFSDGDRGALPDAVTPEHEGAFRTPTLRCIGKQPSFMHTGQLSSLENVVKFFDRGGDRAGYPGTNELVPLELGEEERADLAAFLRSLDGEGPDPTLLEAPSEP
ncbi:MAG TPA: cytochrome c peroxidase [Polyangiaceae bacterium]